MKFQNFWNHVITTYHDHNQWIDPHFLAALEFHQYLFLFSWPIHNVLYSILKKLFGCWDLTNILRSYSKLFRLYLKSRVYNIYIRLQVIVGVLYKKIVI